MTTTKDRIVIGIITISILLTIAVVWYLTALKASASVDSAVSGYQSTTTRTATLGAALTSPTTLSQGYGVLGSVVITGATTGIINLYDETTTAAHSDHATTTLATFPASTAAGTYTFDASYTKGLVYEEVGAAPTTTITWKRR